MACCLSCAICCCVSGLPVADTRVRWIPPAAWLKIFCAVCSCPGVTLATETTVGCGAEATTIVVALALACATATPAADARSWMAPPVALTTWGMTAAAACWEEPCCCC